MSTIRVRIFIHAGVETSGFLRTHQFLHDFIHVWDDGIWSIVLLGELIVFFIHHGPVLSLPVAGPHAVSYT